MRIVKIEAYDDNKGFYKVFSEEGYLLSLPKEIIKSFNLCEGQEVDGSKLNEINEAYLVRRARERMLYSLDRRAHSKKELIEKLKKDYPIDIIEKAILKLEGLGIVNDFEFARAYASDLFNIKKKGQLYIKNALFKKGIDKSICDEVLDELFCDNDIEAQNALEFLKKKNADFTSYEGKNKAYAQLIRRGFSYESAKRAMRLFCTDEEFYED